MSELILKDLVKVYPFTKVSGIIGRRKAAEALRKQKSQPYTTDEGVLAVQDFDLEIKSGDFVVLLGPSGCGKSTLLRMIAGLESVSAGTIIMDGEVINDVPPEERDIAMIFQNYALYPSFTVYDNLAYPLRNRHMPGDEISRIVMETAELLELTDCLYRKPAELSGGQRQRTAIGRALVRHPRVFLMDEPFSNLDAVLRSRLRETIKRIHQQLGTTFIYVTHDQNEAFMLGERIVLMKNGMIEQAGTPQELYLHPASIYCASFIGTPPMNLLKDIPLVRDADGWHIFAFGRDYLLPAEKYSVLPGELSGQHVTLGIRPVNIRPAGNADPDKDCFRAVVEYTDAVESELQIHIKAGDSRLISVLPAVSYERYEKGLELRFIPDLSRVLLFDDASQKRIL